MKKVAVFLLSFVALYIFSCGSGDVAFNKKSWQASAFDEKIGDNDAYRRMGDTTIWGNVTLQFKVVEIGDWDMDADNTVNVEHGLGDNWKKIRGIHIIVRDDTDSNYTDLQGRGNSWAGYWNLSGNFYINLGRVPGGIYDSVNYDLTSYNRGWINIWYES